MGGIMGPGMELDVARMSAKGQLMQRAAVLKAELNGMVQDLKRATPMADSLVLMKSIEKTQRQVDRLQVEIGGLIL